MQPLRVEAHGDQEAFSRLEADWKELLAASHSHTVFSTWQWQQVWWQCFGHGRQLVLLTAREDGGLLGLMPLYRETIQGQAVLQLVGGVDVADYLEVIARRGRERQALGAFMDYLRGQSWQLLDLHSIPASSPTLAFYQALGEEAGFSVEIAQEEVCPAVDLPADWESYLAGLSREDRHELRRKLRRLRNSVAYSWYTVESAEQLPSAVEAFLELHRKSSRHKNSFWTQETDCFFRRLARAMFDEGWLRLSFLEVEGRRAASTFSFDYGGTVSLYNSGFDPEFAHLSVGVTAVAFGIQDCLALGRRTMDFLRGDEPYKYDFGAVDRAIFNIKCQKR